MTTSDRTAVRWGSIIGTVNLIWLYAAYVLGLHTNGVMIFQVFMLVWFLISVTGVVLALRSAKRHHPSWGYAQGLRVGVIVAIVTAIFAVIAQVGYYKVVHPEWPEVMAQQTAEYFESQGASEVEITERVQKARESFTLKNYALQSAVGAMLLGAATSAIAMIFLRKTARVPATETA